jgi:hypothetical protein
MPIPELIPRIEPLGVRPQFKRIPAYLKSYIRGFDDAELQRKLDNLQRYAAEGAGFAIGKSTFFPGEFVKFGYSTAYLEMIGIYWTARWAAVQDALKGVPDWSAQRQRSAAYGYWACRMEFKKRAGPWMARNMLYVVADCLVLGWQEQAIDLAQRVYRALDIVDFFTDYDDSWHPRTQFFVLRLIAAWQGWPQRNWHKWVLDEPLFNALLAHWQTPDASALQPLLLAACDRHTHQSRSNTGSTSYDIDADAYWYDPFEVLTVMKLRQLHRLENPVVDHPLMKTPLGQLREPVPPYSDALLEGVIARVRSTYPDF